MGTRREVPAGYVTFKIIIRYINAAFRGHLNHRGKVWGLFWELSDDGVIFIYLSVCLFLRQDLTDLLSTSLFCYNWL